MGQSAKSVTLSAEQVENLAKKLSSMRHDINNHLALIVAAAELIKFNPDMVQRMTGTLMEQPPKITQEIAKFSREIEELLGLLRN